ncbi:MAG TPA: DUF805 domain-containing protein, partial [Caulobacteraceae bacterium]|nr:DUF805 domain-containing protein [Caulobacteraceae bacterium]
TEIYLLASATQPTRRTEDLGLWGYFKKCMRLYVDGNGRARRKEYWSFVLFSSLFFAALILLIMVPAVATADGGEPPSALFAVFALLFLAGIVGFAIPSIALLSRRLHDIGMSGWFVLVSFIPYIGGLFAFVIALIPSQRGANQYGPSPFEADIAETFS